MRVGTINSVSYLKRNLISNKNNQNQINVKSYQISTSLPDYKVSFGHMISPKLSEDKKIYNALVELKETEEPFTARMLANISGMSLETLYMRLAHNPKLQKFYDEVLYKSEDKSKISTPNKDNAEPLTYKERKSLEVQRDKERIREILLEAKENGIKLSITQISKLTGIPNSVIQSRMSSDETLHTLFGEVMLSRAKKYTMEEKAEQSQAISQLLTTAKDSGYLISSDYIAQTVGINPQTVLRRIQDNKNLRELWAVAGESGTAKAKAKRDFQINSIKTQMMNAIESGQRISIDEISIRTNLSKSAVISRISEDEELGRLEHELRTLPFIPGFKTISKDDGNSAQELPKQDTISFHIEQFKSRIIMDMIADAKLKNKPVPYNLIIDSTGVSKEIIDSFEQIYDKQNSDSGSDDYNKSTKKEFVIPANVRKQEIKNKVLKMIFEAKRNNRKISYSSITNATGVSKEEIDKIIAEYREQKEEYKRQLEIQNAQASEKLRQADIERYGVPQESVKHSDNTDVKRTNEAPLNISDAQIQRIKTMLQNAKENLTLVSLTSIAQNLGIDEKTAYKAIKSRSDLLDVWQEVKAPEQIGKKNKDDD